MPDRTNLDPEVVLSKHRALVALGVGVAVGALIAALGQPQLAPVGGWVVASALVLVWVWRIIWPLDEIGTERIAEAEARSHTSDSAILLASIASIAAVVLALVQAAHGTGNATFTVVVCVISVALSWALVNTVFALKYARLYYLDDDGGIEFAHDEPPAYSDFAYIAYTIGMTFAVAETEPSTRRMRKVMLGHALLSYSFGTILIAVAINLVANLVQSQ